MPLDMRKLYFHIDMYNKFLVKATFYGGWLYIMPFRYFVLFVFHHEITPGEKTKK